MWQYIKGLLIGIFLLWLLFFACFVISDGFVKASIFSITLAKAALSLFQKATGGLGIWIALFIIISAWIWSFGKNKRPAAATGGTIQREQTLVDMPNVVDPSEAEEKH